MTEDFKGDKDTLIPFEKVDQLLTAKGSLLETEVRFIHGRLTTVWKQLPKSVRDLWLLSSTVSSVLSRLIHSIVGHP